MLGVGFEVIGNLILRGECFSCARKSHSGKFDVPGRRKQAQRVPAIPPGISDSVVRIQNQEVDSSLGQVVPHGQSSLASSDDNCVNALRTKLAFHSHLHWDERRGFPDSAHRTNYAVDKKIEMGIFMYRSHQFVLVANSVAALREEMPSLVNML